MKSFYYLLLILLAFTTNSSLGQDLELINAFPNLTFTRPVDLQHPGDGTNRLFILEQPGKIYVFENNAAVTEPTLFLDITDRVDYGGEKGLLGLAFHPDYANNGYFYVNYTAPNPLRTHISRFQVNPQDTNLADKESELVILEYAQPYENHNGGQIRFGPDGFLYIAVGDGGSGGDPQGNAQNLNAILGKILRIDVDNPDEGKNYGIPSDNPFVNRTDARAEIFAYGLRNPWRFSFDPETGDIWAGDVGQNSIEEIDIIRKGENYGWNVMEGSSCYQPSTGCDTTGLTMPVWDYPQQPGSNRSITGGFVYRGSGVPELRGAYIYADYVSGRIWALRYDGENVTENTELLDNNFSIPSFGVDGSNELYVLSFDGNIYRFNPTSTKVETGQSVPSDFKSYANYPNPFNASTTISFYVPEASHLTLTIFDIHGKKVANLLDRFIERGMQRFTWDGRDSEGIALASGVYFHKLELNGAPAAFQKMILLR